MKKNKRGSGKVVVGVVLGFFAIAIIFLIVGLACTIKEIPESIISRNPSAILASEGIVEGRPVMVPVLYRDFGEDNIFQGEESFASKDLGGLTEWFMELDETIPSYSSDIWLNYKANEAEFSFFDDEFYPLDDDTGEHNQMFAMYFGIPITVLSSGDEVFELEADDDTLVFVDDKLVLGMDGIDGLVSGALQIHENGDIYVGVNNETMTYSGVSVARDKGVVIRVFHLDKNLDESVFKMKFAGMSPVLSVSDMKYSGDDSVRVAYDPSGPIPVTASGVGKVFRASNAKELIILATVEGAVLVVFLVVMVNIIKKQKKKKL